LEPGSENPDEHPAALEDGGADKPVADGGPPVVDLDAATGPEGSEPEPHIDSGLDDGSVASDAAWWVDEHATLTCGANADCAPSCLAEQPFCLFECVEAEHCAPTCPGGTLCHVAC